MNDNIQYTYEIYTYDPFAREPGLQIWNLHFERIGSEDWQWCKDNFENFNDYFVHWQDTEIKFGIREQELILK